MTKVLALFLLIQIAVPSYALAEPSKTENYWPAAAEKSQKKVGLYLIYWETKPSTIPLNSFFEMDVYVMHAKTKRPAKNIRLSVEATMPAHGHGMNVTPVIKPVSAGRFHVRGLQLHMPGNWQLQFVIEDADPSTKTARRYRWQEKITLEIQ